MRAWPRARRKRRDCRGLRAVAQPVEEHFACTHREPRIDDVPVRAVRRHAGAHGAGERLRTGPTGVATPPDCQRNDDVQSLAAGGPAKRIETERGQAIPGFLCGFDDPAKIDARPRVQVEHEAARRAGTAGRAVPWMQLDAAHLRNRDQALEVVDLQVRLAVAPDAHGPQRLRIPRPCMALKEAGTRDAVRRAEDRARSPAQVQQHPVSDCLEIARKLELGDAALAACRWPERLARMGNLDPANRCGAALRSRAAPVPGVGFRARLQAVSMLHSERLRNEKPGRAYTPRHKTGTSDFRLRYRGIT